MNKGDTDYPMFMLKAFYTEYKWTGLKVLTECGLSVFLSLDSLFGYLSESGYLNKQIVQLS